MILNVIKIKRFKNMIKNIDFKLHKKKLYNENRMNTFNFKLFQNNNLKTLLKKK